MKEEDIEFSVPENFLKQIYEFSGGAEIYKGMILIMCNEKGEPNIYTQYDSSVVELGLKSALRNFLLNKVELQEK
jgi:hypothetical protein|tara:strand:+ start:800 stop:1024 length:225 start_codon:yes stop_codon:yes gene_type:complete